MLGSREAALASLESECHALQSALSAEKNSSENTTATFRETVQIEHENAILALQHKHAAAINEISQKYGFVQLEISRQRSLLRAREDEVTMLRNSEKRLSDSLESLKIEHMALSEKCENFQRRNILKDSELNTLADSCDCLRAQLAGAEHSISVANERALEESSNASEKEKEMQIEREKVEKVMAEMAMLVQEKSELLDRERRLLSLLEEKEKEKERELTDQEKEREKEKRTSARQCTELLRTLEIQQKALEEAQKRETDHAVLYTKLEQLATDVEEDQLCLAQLKASHAEEVETLTLEHHTEIAALQCRLAEDLSVLQSTLERTSKEADDVIRQLREEVQALCKRLQQQQVAASEAEEAVRQAARGALQERDAALAAVASRVTSLLCESSCSSPALSPVKPSRRGSSWTDHSFTDFPHTAGRTGGNVGAGRENYQIQQDSLILQTFSKGVLQWYDALACQFNDLHEVVTFAVSEHEIVRDGLLAAYQDQSIQTSNQQAHNGDNVGSSSSLANQGCSTSAYADRVDSAQLLKNHGEALAALNSRVLSFLESIFRLSRVHILPAVTFRNSTKNTHIFNTFFNHTIS